MSIRMLRGSLQLGAVSWLALGATACVGVPEGQAVENIAPALEASAAEQHEHEYEQEYEADFSVATAILRDAGGVEVGAVKFRFDGEVTRVDVWAQLPEGEGGVRGMHIHANDKPENGEGCLADPAQPASTHFSSVDGHYAPGGTQHGQHAGDMPALFVTAAGRAAMRFITDRVHPDEIRGRALILHSQADNYGNVPVGDSPDHYHANDPAALDLTARTGNAGARFACGVIE